MADTGSFWDDPFDDSDYFTGPPLTQEMIEAAQASLGYRLPESYLRLIRIKNGGSLKRRCFSTAEPSSWALDHLRIEGIRGIGGEWGIDSELFGTRVGVEEWGYPDVGIVVGEMPSAGHDVIMLDYRECGPGGEPAVIHVETETADGPRILELAPDFETFLRRLEDCGRFEDEEEADPELAARAAASAARIREISGAGSPAAGGGSRIVAFLLAVLAAGGLIAALLW